MKLHFRSFILVLVAISLFSCNFKDTVNKAINNQFRPYLSGTIFIESISLSPSGKIISLFPQAIPNDLFSNNKDIRTISYRSLSISQLSNNNQVESKIIFGIDYATDAFLKTASIIAGNKNLLANESFLYISKNTSNKLNCKIGDNVYVKLQTIYGQANVANFIIGGIFDSSNTMVDNYIYTNRSTLNKLLMINPEQYQLICLTTQKDKDISVFIKTFLQNKLSNEVILTNNYTQTVLDMKNSHVDGNTIILFRNTTYISELFQRIEYENKTLLESNNNQTLDDGKADTNIDKLFD